MAVDLPAGSDLYADAAYVNPEQKSLLFDLEGVTLKAATTKNSLIGNTWAEELENRYYRKRIGNCNVLQVYREAFYPLNHKHKIIIDQLVELKQFRPNRFREWYGTIFVHRDRQLIVMPDLV